jgi:hypothetical protein
MRMTRLLRSVWCQRARHNSAFGKDDNGEQAIGELGYTGGGSSGASCGGRLPGRSGCPCRFGAGSAKEVSRCLSDSGPLTKRLLELDSCTDAAPVLASHSATQRAWRLALVAVIVTPRSTAAARLPRSSAAAATAIYGVAIATIDGAIVIAASVLPNSARSLAAATVKMAA